MNITAIITRFLSWFGWNKLTIDNSVIDEFDVNKFIGNWYEVARFNHFFERGISHTKAEYAFRDDGNIDVTNSGIKNGKPKIAKGKAKLTEVPALLRVSFFGPFYSDYRIMMLDCDYSYALVGSGSDKYLWILSRTLELRDDDRKKILNEAKRRGYDTDRLIWVEQK